MRVILIIGIVFACPPDRDRVSPAGSVQVFAFRIDGVLMSDFQNRFMQATELIGGRYKLTALLQKRVRELVRGERALVELDTKDHIDIALTEVLEGKLEMGAEIQDPEETEILGGARPATDLDLDHDEPKDQISIPL